MSILYLQVSLSCTEGPTIQVSVEEQCQTAANQTEPQPPTTASPLTPAPPSSQSSVELENIMLERMHRKGESGLKVCQARAARIDVVIENLFLAA